MAYRSDAKLPLRDGCVVCFLTSGVVATSSGLHLAVTTAPGVGRAILGEAGCVDLSHALGRGRGRLTAGRGRGRSSGFRSALHDARLHGGGLATIASAV